MNNIVYLLRKPEFFIPLLLWSFLWKGLALWKSANKKQLIWFAALLTVNTVGILEIAYIFFLWRWDIDKGKILNYFKRLTKGIKITK